MIRTCVGVLGGQKEVAVMEVTVNLAQGHFCFQNGGWRKALELAGHVTVLNIHEEINVCSNVANAAFLLVDLNLESRDGAGYEVEVTVLRS